ncbi:unnamed protein product [Lepeophtheirus salmonis]|uniref:(salmon louse) hypothetical protein n=1 Tax=Lepeophtheirus salmonis TaxID=72036 RepID=A0A7R8HD24_LEPSM|nr:unnamed protein product [Lepeophtheirus salmonis]CAF3002262.1 unnamed protein product [Lepeophtheirus salmonis]
MSGNFNKAYWEDVTDTTPIDIIDGCIQFTSVISASFWLINVPKWMSSDVILTTDSLHKNTNRVPYWVRFHAYARKRSNDHPANVQIRVLVLTEADRGVRPLELQEDFKEIARSDFVQVLEKTDIGVEFGAFLNTAFEQPILGAQACLDLGLISIHKPSFVCNQFQPAKPDLKEGFTTYTQTLFQELFNSETIITPYTTDELMSRAISSVSSSDNELLAAVKEGSSLRLAIDQ